MGRFFSTKMLSFLYYFFCLWFSRGRTLGRKIITDQLHDYAIVFPQVEFEETKVPFGPRRRQSAIIKGQPRGAKVSFTAYNKDFTLHLSQNRGLFSSAYVETHHVGDDLSVSMTTAMHCFYHGVIRGNSKSMVAVSTCNGIEGLVDDGNTSFYIEPISTRQHVFYKLRNLRSKQPLHSAFYTTSTACSALGPQSRQGLRQRVRRNVFEETKFVELVVVNDKSQFEANDGDISRSNFRAKQIVNLVDAIFKPVNVRVALMAVETWNTKNLIDTDTDASKYLNNFQEYRRSRLLSRQPNDNAQLLTRIPFKNSVRGKAHVMSICTHKSVGVVQDHSINAAFTANTFAHELGHSFGMYHDWSNCTCNARTCIMATHVGSEPATKFSTCSEVSLRTTLARGLGSCLFNTPMKLFGGPVCGNGFVEEGEECDCGTARECAKANDTCCDYSRCKLHRHAECTDGECCENCKFKPRGTVCRAQLNECDLAEECPGSMGLCPPDVHVQDGYRCADGAAFCYNGECPTQDQQCQMLWGRNASSGPSFCYDYVNSQANEFGHCREANGMYIACKKEDVKCGKLLCLSNKKLPILGIQRSVKVFSWKISGKSISCKSANLEMGLDVMKPGVTLEGTRCGKGRICLDRKCVSLKLVKSRRPRCRKNCSNRGVCDNEGKCHCFSPWAGSTCRINISHVPTTRITTSQHPKSTVPCTTKKYHSTWWTTTDYRGGGGSTPGETQSQSTTKLVVIAVVSFSFVVFLGVLGLVVHRCRKSTHSYKLTAHKGEDQDREYRVGAGTFSFYSAKDELTRDMVATVDLNSNKAVYHTEVLRTP